ncbi:MAG: alpha/beta hydrolase [Rhodoplanes sp.]|uniref:alpha/beta hydrolase n=1 Tax=Rhodoplanes sp. TaxID=1968906 RepID=UPI0018589630|nr:alpha/beta hydrolase [Rhodoplanes sp.]NVO16906.1 alpha/beta hydrolase [Rhodoplanes sp.]
MGSNETALSRRTLLRAMSSAGAALALGGCAGLGTEAPAFDASALAAQPSLMVATNRRAVNGAQAQPWFGSERGSTTIARARLAAPDGGRFSLAAVGLSDWSLTGVERVPQVEDLFRGMPTGRDVLVYIHGYNTTFETAVLDAVHLSDGISFRGSTMLFSWPSRAKLLDYGYDRESAMWSRDSLERVLDQLIVSPTVGRINIVAHSIGTMLTLEALRQVYARRGDDLVSRIGAVVFASPDIDMDVFTSSVGRIGGLAPKITVVTATNDRALAVSRLIAGGVTRVGAAEKAQLERLGIRVIDASDSGFGVINHDLFLSNEAIRGVIRRAIETGTYAGVPMSGPLPGGPAGGPVDPLSPAAAASLQPY